MNNQLPPGAQTEFDKIVSKLIGILETAREHTSARSEFMDYDGSMGGQVLMSTPRIEHDSNELSTLYRGVFEQAKKEGVELREIETLFERRTQTVPWTHRTRWVEVGEFKAFTKKIAPLVDDIGASLRKLGAETAPDWYRVSFDPGPQTPGIIVLRGAKVRIVREPTPELMQHAARVIQVARDQGLEVIGASWRVSNEDEDGDVRSAVRVLRAWPAAT
jgi:hypothetical protein